MCQFHHAHRFKTDEPYNYDDDEEEAGNQGSEGRSDSDGGRKSQGSKSASKPRSFFSNLSAVNSRRRRGGGQRKEKEQAEGRIGVKMGEEELRALEEKKQAAVALLWESPGVISRMLCKVGALGMGSVCADCAPAAVHVRDMASIKVWTPNHSLSFDWCVSQYSLAMRNGHVAPHAHPVNNSQPFFAATLHIIHEAFSQLPCHTPSHCLPPHSSLTGAGAPGHTYHSLPGLSHPQAARDPL